MKKKSIKKSYYRKSKKKASKIASYGKNFISLTCSRESFRELMKHFNTHCTGVKILSKKTKSLLNAKQIISVELVWRTGDPLNYVVYKNN